MITRFALFEGTVREGQTQAFRADVLTVILPEWKKMPGALEVRVAFADSRDEGAPQYPLILAINYPDKASVEAAVASPQRLLARAATESVLSKYFEGRVHHHVTQANEFTVERTSFPRRD